MINDVLEFICKSSLQVMIGEGKDHAEVQFIANTTKDIIKLKIENKHPFTLKVKHIANTLTKQNLGEILDVPISFIAKANMLPNSTELEMNRDEDGEILVKIEPLDEFATKFLHGFSRNNVEISLPIREIPKFDNPRL